jgi:hypothetical protein
LTSNSSSSALVLCGSGGGDSEGDGKEVAEGKTKEDPGEGGEDGKEGGGVKDVFDGLGVSM